MNFTFREVYTISNLLSIIRLLLSIPLFILINQIHTSTNARYLVILILLIAAVTDFLDGYIARKRNEITEFGKIVDPLADKVLIIFTVFQLFLIDELPAYFFYIILTRDLLIFLGGIYLTKRIGKVLPSNLLGKITFTIIGLFVLAEILELENNIPFIYLTLMYLSIGLSVASVIGYGIRAKETLIWYKNESVQKH